MVDYSQDTELAMRFLNETSLMDPDTGSLEKKYVNQLQRIANHESTVLRIELDDVSSFEGAVGVSFAKRIDINAWR